MTHNETKKRLRGRIEENLHAHLGITLAKADAQSLFTACAITLRNIMTQRRLEAGEDRGPRQVHYLSMEFLPGRSLRKNAFNLGLSDALEAAVEEMGFSPADLFETEPDAALGGGGLGRLAACYMDSMTTLNIPATGYSICYELGAFKQKIINGRQTELADPWLGEGAAWLITKSRETEKVRFGGEVSGRWENGRYAVSYSGYTEVLAVPRDMEIAGYRTENISRLRLWEAKSPHGADLSLYNAGQYAKAVEEQAMAAAISTMLYPADHHEEGRLLRLRQQYFFVSATVQSIVRGHKVRHGTLRNFHKAHVIHINDTHPALAIVELLRILLDEEGLSWDEGWSIVTRSAAYTNHTVMSEALEVWPQRMVQRLLPRVWQLLCEISDRCEGELVRFFGGDRDAVAESAILWNGQVRMANLCVYACFAVNGVSALHTEILKSRVFTAAYRRTPEKFIAVTNGIDHRRWLAQSNPRLHELICGCLGGDDYLLRPGELAGLEAFAGDAGVLSRLGEIKAANKRRLADYVLNQTGIPLNPDAIFDVQAKRLHEYKRQLLNALDILRLYQALKENPAVSMPPRVFIFAAKAAPSYAAAKEIIRFICALADRVNSDPVCRGRLQVVFLENYRVSLAELLIPAAELSEQISAAGTEASGTGNMKFMMNGALTIGTLDGAGAEMHSLLGDEHFFRFGLRDAEAAERRRRGYRPAELYRSDPTLKRLLDTAAEGFGGGSDFKGLINRLLYGEGAAPDAYMLLADFDSYRRTRERAGESYGDAPRWNSSALVNIARSGGFAADRSVREYANRIWHVPVRE